MSEKHAPWIKFIYGPRDGERSTCPWTEVGWTPLTYDGYAVYEIRKHKDDGGALCGVVYVWERTWRALAETP